MWFVTTMHKHPNFYAPDHSVLDVSKIEWIKDSEFSSDPLIQDPMQAISALFEAGIKGFTTKPEARTFAKKLPVPNWKYLQIK